MTARTLAALLGGVLLGALSVAGVVASYVYVAWRKDGGRGTDDDAESLVRLASAVALQGWAPLPRGKAGLGAARQGRAGRGPAGIGKAR